MRKAVGVLMITLLLGSIVAAAGSTAYAATIESQTDPYEAFWEMLNREAELVVQFNTTGNTTLAQELIQNSRLGADNAANISALIWQALEELKASGVKTYYTAEELREMAQNISQNGLPEETVQALKEQGWTDEQIQALKEYIVQNADEIDEDFNMTAFLEKFSMAFIDVAFKYNHYEAWALEKWKWNQPAEAPTANNGELINPVLADPWTFFYMGYYQKDYQKMKLAINNLREATYKLITGQSGTTTLMLYQETGITTLQGKVENITPVKNGGLMFKTVSRSTTPTQVTTTTTVYYWPSALEAYELVEDIYTLINARNYGNANVELDWILNQKVAELKEALGVAVIESNTDTTPIEPKPLPIKNPIILPATLSSKEPSSTIADNSISTTGIQPEGVTLLALTPENTEGILKVSGIKVVVDSNAPGKVEYHVEVELSAENNAINDIKISVDDYTSGDSDSGSISFLNSEETYTWESRRFSVTHTMDGELHVSGKVEVTYTPSCGAVPLSSGEPETLSTSQSCGQRTITREYSAVIDLTPPVDWSKVHLSVEASRTSITEGESVTYRVVVRNENDAPLDDLEYSVTIPYSPTNSRTYSGVASVNKTEQVIFSETVTYTDASTYVTHASIYWNGKSKSAQTSVTVTSDQNEERSMNGAFSFSPSTVYAEDTVTFHYVVTTSDGQLYNPTVTLEIDNGPKIFEKTYYGVVVTPDSHLEDYTTYTFINAGTYRITLKVNGLPLYSKTIEVKTPPELALSLECPNDPVLLGETGVCDIIVKKNTLSSDVPYAITSKTIDNDRDTSMAISVNILRDVIPAKFSSKIAEVFVPFDERMAEALELSDVRDLTPPINVWSCEDGTCHYTLKRADTPHYLKITVRLGSDHYISLEGIVVVKYTGSKYWNVDANDGIIKGTAMAFSPALLSGLSTFSEITAIESSTGMTLTLTQKARVALEATFGVYGKLVGGSIGVYNLAETIETKESTKEKAKGVAEYFLKPLFLPGG